MVGAYVKESTRPVDFVSHSDVRAMERVEFNQQGFTIYFKIKFQLTTCIWTIFPLMKYKFNKIRLPKDCPFFTILFHFLRKSNLFLHIIYYIYTPGAEKALGY